MQPIRILTLAAPLVLAAAAFAQGTDSCASPTVLVGEGLFSWSTTAATQSPESQATCAASILRDVWFQWVAPTTDNYTLDCCNLSGLNTAFAVYAGAGCPSAPSIACNDDACNTQSRVTFAATAGSAYTFQLGFVTSGPGFNGMFRFGHGTPRACGGSTGPDVIVGDMPDIANYAAASGLDAIAIGTTSCNIGTAPLPWIAATNQHPVIGGNLYRYKTIDGAPRFEQVGISWLKHGFAAAAGSICCSCQNPGSGSQLGVGCSDPYVSVMNGTQTSAGPRWQVDASTGAFPYPPANPAWSGSTARRLEFALADVDAGAGTRYFGECQYVTPNDAAAGNQDNNASWREMTVGGTATERTFTLIGLTQRTQSAIRAWGQIDPAVVTTDVHADGLFVVASRAYDLGGGLHRYEYAVYNMNSHRSGGTFSVPVPVGANVTNAGFHGVTYRNGDGSGSVDMSSTDWTFALSGGVATWSTETEAQNVRANAIRWGTTYNFRFDCDVAPKNGTAMLGLWRAGSPNSLNAAAKVPGPIGGSSVVCAGDGLGTPCPCGNNGTSSTGCLHSLGAGGALAATGTASVSSDSLLLTGSGMPNAACLYFQGNALVNGGAGAVFGDGLRCAGGFVTRLATKVNALGTSSYPQVGDASVSVQGTCTPGDLRVYQVWYRNAASFCSPDTFNLTNAWQLVWQS